MIEIINQISNLLDWLFAVGISPLYHLICQGLAYITLKPLALLHTPLPLQVLLMGILFGFLSRRLRHLLRVHEYENRFQKSFAAKKENQQHLDAIEDWKLRQELYKYSDSELDDDYNTYLAHRFAQHGVVYLLPIFFAMAWLEQVLPTAAPLFHLGIADLGRADPSKPIIFFVGYLATLFVCSRRQRLSRDCGQPIDTAIRIG